MRRIIEGYLFDTNKMECVGGCLKQLWKLKLYKGKEKYAVFLETPVDSSLDEITVDEFKELLCHYDTDKYIELYGDELQDA